MNGRVYDPLTAQFLSPDPYVQAPDNWLNYNRYAYCLNNPLIYTDPTGEYAIVDDIIAGALGGLINLGVNAFQGNLSGYGFWGGVGRGLAAFAAGAVGGVGALYPEFGGWAWGGAIVGATNAWLGGATSVKDIAIGAGIGAIAGIAGGAAGQFAVSSASPLLSSISSPVLRGAATGLIGGAIGGYVGGFTGGLIMTGDLRAANSAGLNGMMFGAVIGGVAGAGAGYKYAIDNKINPWNGKPNAVETPYQTPQAKGQEGVNRAKQEIVAEGGEVVMREVTLEVNGVRVRVDIAADFNGEITLVEVKNGPSAGFTRNQRIVYPQMMDGVPIIPRGKNAARIPQFKVGQPTIQYKLIIKRY